MTETLAEVLGNLVGAPYNRPTEWLCTRCEVQWCGDRACWLCGTPGHRLPRRGTVLGMSVHFNPILEP